MCVSSALMLRFTKRSTPTCRVLFLSYDGGSYRGSYDEGSMRGSYARGRGRNARRDSMGRYSSGNEMMMEQLQDLMEESPDDRTRQEIQKLMSKLG